MNPLRFPSLLILLAWSVASVSLHAEDLQKPHSVDQHLQSETLPSIRSGGAHGSKDPHGKLTPEMHVQVALQHKAEGRMGEAMRSLDLAIRNNPFSPELFAVRGSFYLERDNVSAALSDFESALKLSPDSAAILTNRAQAYRHFGRIGEALQDLDRAIELSPDLLAAYFNRGAIHFSSNSFDLALQDFDSCIAIDPHSAGPYFNRAATRDALGDREGAIEDIKRFMEIAADSSWQKAAQELLDKWQSERADSKNDNSNS